MNGAVGCKFVLIAESAHFDEENLLTITRIFNILGVNRTPAPTEPGKFCVVSLWDGPRGKNAKFTLQMRQVNINRVLESADLDVDFGPTGRGRHIAPIEGFVFPAYGDYSFEILREGAVLASELLAVVPPLGIAPK